MGRVVIWAVDIDGRVQVFDSEQAAHKWLKKQPAQSQTRAVIWEM